MYNHVFQFNHKPIQLKIPSFTSRLLYITETNIHAMCVRFFFPILQLSSTWKFNQKYNSEKRPHLFSEFAQCFLLLFRFGKWLLRFYTFFPHLLKPSVRFSFPTMFFFYSSRFSLLLSSIAATSVLWMQRTQNMEKYIQQQ